MTSPESGERGTSVYLHTLGCPKNEWDSDLLLSGLKDRGFIAAEADSAEVVVVNTCAFIEEARRESVEEILHLADLKKAGTCRLLAVTGCLAERYRDSLPALLPEVDAFVPLTSAEPLDVVLARLPGVEDESAGTSPMQRRCCPSAGTGMAYLKISEGCDRACSFYAIPGIRGALASRPLPDILEEASWLKGLGVRELVLVAQDITAYGSDLYGTPSLGALLGELCAEPGEFRVRLLYMQPEGIDDGLLEAMATPKVCRYLDMPLQHVSRDILRAMGRPGSPEHFRKLLGRVQLALPGVALRSTMLVGFPGETRREYAALQDFVREGHFDWPGVFGYSREEGTRAYALGRGASHKIVEARCAGIMDIQNEIMWDRAAQQVGSRLQVLVERRSDTLAGHMEGRSARHAPEIDELVYVRGDLEPGRFYQVEITGTEGIDEVARVAE